MTVFKKKSFFEILKIRFVLKLNNVQKNPHPYLIFLLAIIMSGLGLATGLMALAFLILFIGTVFIMIHKYDI
jgi:hypothetical protein